MVVGGWWLGGRRGGRWLWLEFSGGEEGEEGMGKRERRREKKREKEGHWLLLEREI